MANRTTNQRLVGLKDAVAEVKEELTGLRFEMNVKFEEQGKKLDKILEVVVTKEKRTDERLTRLERISGIAPSVQ